MTIKMEMEMDMDREMDMDIPHLTTAVLPHLSLCPFSAQYPTPPLPDVGILVFLCLDCNKVAMN